MLLTYEAEIDEQGVIKLRDLIRFPRRRVLVTVLDEYADESQEAEPPSNSMVDVLRELAGSVEAPADWSAEHDHYLYGTPKNVETQFQAEADAFDQLLPKLIETHSGQVVAIYQGEVIAHGEDKLQLLRDVREAHGQIVCYVGKVTTTPRIARITSAHIKS